MTKLIKILFFILFFISCGRNEAPPLGYTRVVFNGQNGSSQKGALINYPLNNGLYVQVINSDVQKQKSGSFLNIADFIGKSSLILPNGRYKFFAFGYDGVATNVFHSDFFCEPFNNGADTILAGGVVNINLILNSSANSGKCRHPHFMLQNFLPAGSDVRELTIGLHAGPPTNANLDSRAVEVVIPTVNTLEGELSPGAEGLKKCFVPTFPQLKVPISLHIPMRFIIKSTTSCNSSVAKVIDFPNGIGQLPVGTLDPVNTLGNYHLVLSTPASIRLNIN
jgi:hypothetical protein